MGALVGQGVHPGRQEVSLPISRLVNALGGLGRTGVGEAGGHVKSAKKRLKILG